MYFSCFRRVMRVKLTIFILSTFLLWSSLLAVSHHNNISKHQEIKISAELVSKAIVSDDNFIWKKSSYQLHSVLINFAKTKIVAVREQLYTASHFTQKSVRYYLLFRVLRN
jgi:hypothetical protein